MPATSRYQGRFEVRSARGDPLGEAEGSFWMSEDASGRVTWGGSLQFPPSSRSLGIGERIQLCAPGGAVALATASITWRTARAGEAVGVCGKGLVPF
jgi:hypothetical protein